MNVIYKYKICSALHGDSLNEIDVPSNAKFLKVGRQNNDICAWYIVDDEEALTRKVKWIQCGTGHPYQFLSDAIYADTIICDDLGLVWNMFYYDL